MTNKTPPKSINVSLRFLFDQPKITETQKLPSGEIILLFEGERVYPKQVYRDVYRANLVNGNNKPKILSRMPLDPKNIYEDGMKGAMAQYQRVFAISTNHDLKSKGICTGSFVEADFLQIDEKIIVKFQSQIRVLELTNLHVNPEKFVWREIIKNIINDNSSKIGIIVDSDLENIEAYNNKEKPIIDQFYLPDNIELIYACDKGHESVNQVMKLVDMESKQFLKQLRREKIKRAPAQPCNENPKVNAFLYTSYTELNNIIVQ
jgi:hypothetical protein